MSRISTVRSDVILLVTAVIWGFAFVAQRMGMEHIGPFLFNGIRFGLGALVLVAVQWLRGQGDKRTRGPGDMEHGTRNIEHGTFYGILLGLILFAGASFQQVGIVYTTAGNAGFITGLYVILVPLLGMFAGQRASWNLWTGAMFAVVGLYFLSITSGMNMSPGDLLVLVSAIFWAIHVLYTGWLSPRMSAIKLAITQFVVCSVLSLLSALTFEEIIFSDIYQAIWPILYGGILSVGIAYTLQIVGQKKAPPTHAAIIMSLETVFAVIGGVLILSETMNERKWIGCGLMLLGMIMAQVKSRQSAVSSQQSAVSSRQSAVGGQRSEKISTNDASAAS